MQSSAEQTLLGNNRTQRNGQKASMTVVERGDEKIKIYLFNYIFIYNYRNVESFVNCFIFLFGKSLFFLLEVLNKPLSL